MNKTMSKAYYRKKIIDLRASIAKEREAKNAIMRFTLIELEVHRHHLQKLLTAKKR